MWLEEYLGICWDIPFAGLEYHSYAHDVVGDVVAFREFTDELGYGDLPIWLSEFAGCHDAHSPAEIVAGLEMLPYVERYAWFANRAHPDPATGEIWWEWCNWWLLDDTGSPTARGVDYLAALEW